MAVVAVAADVVAAADAMDGAADVAATTAGTTTVLDAETNVEAVEATATATTPVEEAAAEAPMPPKLDLTDQVAAAVLAAAVPPKLAPMAHTAVLRLLKFSTEHTLLRSRSVPHSLEPTVSCTKRFVVPAALALDTTRPTVPVTARACSNTTAASPSSIPCGAILLDSDSSHSLFRDFDLCTDIRKEEHSSLKLDSNGGGFIETSLTGCFQMFPQQFRVWVDKDAMANVLALAEVKQHLRVTIDTAADEDAFLVHISPTKAIRFGLHKESNLYLYDPNDHRAIVDVPHSLSFLQSVRKNKTFFTKHEVKQADEARQLYAKVMRPSERRYESILANHLIDDCPVTSGHARRAHFIYGNEGAFVKGARTKHKAAPHVPTRELVPLSPHILKHHKKVTLGTDFLYVQGLPFLHTISRKIGYRSTVPVRDRKKDTMLAKLEADIEQYSKRGFDVVDVHADKEFECIADDIKPHAEICPADAHVPIVERSVRTMKETCRKTIHGLPFERLPRLMVRRLVKEVDRCLNMFPYPEGISKLGSPDSIVTGNSRVSYKDLYLEFGAYVQLHEPETDNTMRGRSYGAIALGPSANNTAGSWDFMSLATGRLIPGRGTGSWTEIPIDDNAISRVNTLAADEGMPLIQDDHFVVEWRPGQAVDDDVYDRNYAPPTDRGRRRAERGADQAPGQRQPAGRARRRRHVCRAYRSGLSARKQCCAGSRPARPTTAARCSR